MTEPITCIKCRNKTFVSISKKFNNSEIHMFVTDGLSLNITLEDFKEAIKKEIGSVTWTFMKTSFEKQVDEAFQKVVKGVKDESAKVAKYVKN